MFDFPPPGDFFSRILFGPGLSLLWSPFFLGVIAWAIVAPVSRRPVSASKLLIQFALWFGLAFAAHWPSFAKYSRYGERERDLPSGELLISWIAVVSFATVVHVSLVIFWRRTPIQVLSRSVEAVMVVLLIGILVALLQPAVVSRPASNRSQSQNNLKQISLAIHNFESIDGQKLVQIFRPHGVDESWRIAVLPYLDQSATFDSYNESFAWNHPKNTTVSRLPIGAFLSPARERIADSDGFAFGSYGVVHGPGTAFAIPGQTSKLPKNTIIAGECEGLNLRWAEPRDADTAKQKIGINLPGSQPGFSDGIFSSYWADGGVNILRADGSVDYLAKNTDPEVLRKLLDPKSSAGLLP